MKGWMKYKNVAKSGRGEKFVYAVFIREAPRKTHFGHDPPPYVFVFFGASLTTQNTYKILLHPYKINQSHHQVFSSS